MKCAKRGNVLISDGAKQLRLTHIFYAPSFRKNILHTITTKLTIGWLRGHPVASPFRQLGGILNFKKDGVSYYLQGVRTTLASVMNMEVYNSKDNSVPDVNPILPTFNSTTKRTASKFETKGKQPTINIHQAHEKYGHVLEAALQTTLKSIGVQPTGKLCTCDGCALAKAKAK